MSLRFEVRPANPLRSVVQSIADAGLRIDVRQKEAVETLYSAYSLGPPAAGSTAIDPDPTNQLERRPGGLYAHPSTWQSNEW